MEPIIADNIYNIGQAISLLESIDDDLYTRASAQSLGAGIGGHIRHNIDHYESFLGSIAQNRIDYENRQRDPRLETDPAAARARLTSIGSVLQSLDLAILDSPIEVKMENAGDAPEAQWATTSARRELQFLLSHTVHHHALIAMICRQLGTDIPEDFGVAPSTLRHRQQLPRPAVECAP